MTAAVYFCVPLLAPGPPSAVDADTFGRPWTLESLTAALRASGVAVDLTHVEGKNEILKGLPGNAIVAIGTIGGYRGSITVHQSIAQRQQIWVTEHPGQADVRPRGYGTIPEVQSWSVGNAVVTISTLIPPQGPSASVGDVLTSLKP